jgi:hypothetical protein
VGDEQAVRAHKLPGPSWVASPTVKQYWDGLTPLQRLEMDVPDTLISLDELAGP